jgi:serine protease
MRRMNTLLSGTLVLVLAACQDTSQLISPAGPTADVVAEPSFSVQQGDDRVMPGRVLVGLSPQADPLEVGRAHGTAFERMGAGGTFAVFQGAVGNERALAARMRGDADVLWAEPDYLREPTKIDSKLWAFYNPGDLFVRFTKSRGKGQPVTSYYSFADADEDNIEGYAAGGVPVSIASIDTGVDFYHPEFGAVTLVPGWDYYSNDADPSDTNDHGTHTTGTMVGDNVGVAGVAGAAGNVTVYVYRVCGALGCPSSAIADAITDATDVGVVAMNLSLGGSSISTAEEQAIAYATGGGSLVIASAGNGGSGTVRCPACDPNAISVAASNWLDELAYYSSWGTGLDITAPGGELYSNTTEEAGIWSSVRGGGYAYFQGTSMAAPQVTGTAAIVASVKGWTGAAINGTALRAALEGSADDLGNPGYDTKFGHGRLNSYRAVTGITLNEGDPPPPPEGLQAAFTYSCGGLSCDFDGSSSTGTITRYEWRFWDGDLRTGVRLSKTFPGVGSFEVLLEVFDADGSDTATNTIQCTMRGKSLRCK